MTLPSRCVVDANIIFDFACGGLLDSLFAAGMVLVTTDLVAEELCEPPRLVVETLGLRVESLSERQMLELQALAGRLRQTSQKDRSAYVLARSLGLVLLTGDAELRACAEADGVEVHGTLYLLDALVATHLVEPARAAEALRTMRSSGSWLPSAECKARLRKWGEERR